MIQKYFEEALELARQARGLDEVPVGALVVREGEIIGKGFNRKESECDITAHAEILAMRDAAKTLQSWRLTGCHLISTLEPCPMCLAASQQARISQLIYGAKDPKGGAISLGYRLDQDSRLNHRFEIQYVENLDCSQILSNFFKSKRL